MTEETLMIAYGGGDAGAFEQLYARLGPKLHGFFMRSFNNEAVAADLLQTTLLKLHRARRDFRPGLPFRPWVFAIAARVRLDEYRKRRQLPEPLDEESDAGAGAAEGIGSQVPAELDARERAQHVRAALAALPESQRVIIHLHRFEGLTFGEIARVLGSTEGAVKLKAFRGYERLRKQLRPLLDAEGAP